MKKHSFGSRLFLGLVLLVLYLPIVVVVIYSFNDNSARIPLAFTGWTTRWYGELLGGKGGDSFFDAAQKIGTISYELVCSVARRVPRVYMQGGEAVSATDYLEGE